MIDCYMVIVCFVFIITVMYFFSVSLIFKSISFLVDIILYSTFDYSLPFMWIVNVLNVHTLING